MHKGKALCIFLNLKRTSNAFQIKVWFDKSVIFFQRGSVCNLSEIQVIAFFITSVLSAQNLKGFCQKVTLFFHNQSNVYSPLTTKLWNNKCKELSHRNMIVYYSQIILQKTNITNKFKYKINNYFR